MGDALTKGQIVMGAGVGALVLAGVVVTSFSSGGPSRPTETCRLELAGAEVPLLPTPEAAVAAFARGGGSPAGDRFAGAVYAPAGATGQVLERRAGAIRVRSGAVSGWVTDLACHP